MGKHLDSLDELARIALQDGRDRALAAQKQAVQDSARLLERHRELVGEEDKPNKWGLPDRTAFSVAIGALAQRAHDEGIGDDFFGWPEVVHIESMLTERREREQADEIRRVAD